MHVEKRPLSLSKSTDTHDPASKIGPPCSTVPKPAVFRLYTGWADVRRDSVKVMWSRASILFAKVGSFRRPVGLR